MMRAMQAMDLLNQNCYQIARMASILELELEGRDTLTGAEINTMAKLVCQDCKEGGNACSPFLEMNLVRYATFPLEHRRMTRRAAHPAAPTPPWTWRLDSGSKSQT